MKLAEMLAVEFLTIHRGEVTQNHYTALYDLLHSLIECHKPINKQLLNRLDYIYKNTSQELILPLPISEELFFKYRALDIKNRGNFNITYTNRSGFEKIIGRNYLKYELSKAKSSMFHLFALTVAKYNYDIPIKDSKGGV